MASHDPDTGAYAVFLVHRGTDGPITVDVDVSRLGDVWLAEATTLADDDPYAANTLAEPQRVAMHENASAAISDGLLRVELFAVSWTAIALRAGGA